MSNEKKHTDPFESFFEEKANNYDIPYKESDWEKLEERLDKADALYYRRRRMTLAAVAALLIAVLAYFTYQNHTALNRLSEQLNEQQITQAENDTADDQSSGTLEEPVVTGKESLPTDIDTPPNNTQFNLADSPQNEIDSSQHNDAIAVANQLQNEQVKQTISAGQTEGLFISEINCETCRTSVNEPGESLYEPIQITRPTQTMAAVASIPDSDEPAAAEIRTRRKPNIAVGLIMAPDLSTVGGLSNFDNPGYKVGVTAEVKLLDRLAITGGIIHSTVNYRARDREYQTPAGYEGQTIIPQQTFAECALLDIPINLKYDVAQWGRSRFYASAGVASYIMLNEDYRFEYENYAAGQPQEWSAKSGTKHWLSNASFSLGYEWALHPNWGVQVEPFVRLPLKEVGWGNVKLYSVGTFISLNYRLQ